MDADYEKDKDDVSRIVQAYSVPYRTLAACSNRLVSNLTWKRLVTGDNSSYEPRRLTMIVVADMARALRWAEAHRSKLLRDGARHAIAEGLQATRHE